MCQQARLTSCMHDPSVKGSALAPKVRWAIARGMYREQIIFIDPYSKASFRSKSYTAYRLNDGINWFQLLKLSEIESTRKQLALPEDVMEPIGTAVQLQPIVAIAETDFTFQEKPLMAPSPGGSVSVVDAAGRKMLTDTDTGVLYYPQEGIGRHQEVIPVLTNKLNPDLGDKETKPTTGTLGCRGHSSHGLQAYRHHLQEQGGL